MIHIGELAEAFDARAFVIMSDGHINEMEPIYIRIKDGGPENVLTVEGSFRVVTEPVPQDSELYEALKDFYDGLLGEGEGGSG